MKTSQGKPSIVFCHGLWADGSCFSKVIPAFQAEGHQVIAAQYGLNSTADDVATVRSTLGRVSSPAILVGHSYGGSVITGAGTTIALRGWSTSPRSLRTPMRHLRHSSLTSRRRTSSLTSKSRTDGSGCVRKASTVSQAICPSRKRSSFGRPSACRLPTCSTQKLEELPGNRSQAGTSLPRTTALSTPTWNASLRSGWTPPRRRSPAATFPCSPTPTW
jgi:hypothetical protein